VKPDRQRICVHAHELRNTKYNSVFFAAFAAFAFQWRTRRHSTQKPQNSQNNTRFLCGFRELCVDRRG